MQHTHSAIASTLCVSFGCDLIMAGWSGYSRLVSDKIGTGLTHINHVDNDSLKYTMFQTPPVWVEQFTWLKFSKVPPFSNPDCMAILGIILFLYCIMMSQ